MAALGLLGVQQVTDRTAYADAPRTQDPRSARVSPSPTTVGQPHMVSGAVATGTFEEPVRPTPMPTLMPAPSVQTVDRGAIAAAGGDPPRAAEPAPEAAAGPPPAVFESGIASTYGVGDGFEGNRTACGQIFHTQAVQAAHKSLPCGTRIRVEDAASGRSVVAEVTDRGPYVRGRIVDLSWAAFRQLTPSPGLLQVNLYVVGADG